MKTGKLIILISLISIIGSMNLCKVQAYGLSGSFEDSNGISRNYSDYEGNFIFLEAFATNCGYCKQQHPILVKLNNAYGNDVVFLSIAVWNSQETQDTLAAYDENYPASWTVGIDSGQLKNELSVVSTPNMFLLDDKGEVIVEFTGLTQYDDISPYIEKYVLDNTDVTLPDTTSTQIGNPNSDSLLGRLFSNVFFQIGVGVSVVTAIYIRSVRSS